MRDDTAGFTAPDILNRRAIRFVNGHQLREAIWLMSEMHKHSDPATPQPLFLQDNEARLFGQLSPWRLIAQMMRELDHDHLAAVDDKELGECLRVHLTRRINTIARRDLPDLTADSHLGELLQAMLRHGDPVLPICDGEGRIMGLVEQFPLLRVLAEKLEPGEASE